MGYYTSFGLTILEGDTSIIKTLREENENARFAIDDNGYHNNSAKWYECERELETFSKKHPDVLFQLEGDGEESGDTWKLYVKDGCTQLCKAKVVWDQFDKGRLLSDIRDSRINQILTK